jgi:hypothetical protein
MLIKIIRPEIVKVVECQGYEFTRYWNEELLEGKVVPHRLPNLEHPPAGKESYMVLTPRYDQIGIVSASFSIPEKSGNSIYIMNNQGDTIERYIWR